MIMLIKAAAIGCSSQYIRRLESSQFFRVYPVDASSLFCLSATKNIARMRVDIFLINVEKKGEQGFSLTRTIRRFSRAVLILLGRHKSRHFVSRALSMSDGYCLNGVSPEELRLVFLAAYSGRLFVAPPTALPIEGDVVPIQALPPEQRRLVKANPLSNCELQILNLVALGYCNRQIAQKLYISEATVKTQLRSIYTKLAVNNRVSAVVQALRCGIVF